MSAQNKTTKKTQTTFDKTQKFAAKKLGANMIASIGTERYSKKVTMEEGTNILGAIEKYNKRPSETAKNKIIAMLTPEATKKKVEAEKTTAKVKGLKQQVKKEKKVAKKAMPKKDLSLIEQLETAITEDETAIPKLQAILDKFKKKPEPVAQVTQTPTRREAYRNGQRVYIYEIDGVEVNADGTPLKTS